MSAIRRHGRAFLGLPALDDPAAMKRLRVVPWLATPAAFAVALVGWTAIGIALQRALSGSDNWQVNAPAIAGLTAILLLAPSSPTQPKARNAWLAAIVGLAVVGAAFGIASAGHDQGTAYSATAFVVVALGALAGCVVFTALTRVERWSVAAQADSGAGVLKTKDATTGATTIGDATDADAADADDRPSADA
ncbi:hypothetical protein Raf01_24730 [Rugosimonospora africana]|uniref:Transmembrane protein n=2 Tax=Rugosimonospora africana TaxID=556532 RepID=A0A8J3QSL2_9ACTN|nr:hypothetical protein Raf01_24730 [Rugosimonospora africana]